MAVVRALVNDNGEIREYRDTDTLVGAGVGTSNACTATIDFGVNEHDAFVTVTGQAWVTSTSVIVCNVLGEEAAVQSIIAYARNLVVGTGFTIHAHAPNGANGVFTVNCVGV